MSRQSRPCPVCLSPEAQPVYDNRMACLDGMDMSYTVARCNRCGFHFAQQLASDATISRYYKAVSKYDVAITTSALDQTRIDAAVSICQRHVPFDAMVVDLGCGDGAFLAGLQAAGFSNLHGIDPAPLAAQQAHARFGLGNIRVSTINQAHTVLPLENADLVCVMAVLEHLPQLRQDMARLLAQLRPGCQVLVEVPALDLFEAQGAEPLGELSLEHIQFFGRRSLENFFSSLGARIVVTKILNLPAVKSGSLFGLFEIPAAPPAQKISKEFPAIFDKYINESLQELGKAINKIPETPFILYGAGSHTARLIPKLQKSSLNLIKEIIDNNHNLHGRSFGEWTIKSPEQVLNDRPWPIVISSFRSQNSIELNLKEQFNHSIIKLY